MTRDGKLDSVFAHKQQVGIERQYEGWSENEGTTGSRHASGRPKRMQKRPRAFKNVVL